MLFWFVVLYCRALPCVTIWCFNKFQARAYRCTSCRSDSNEPNKHGSPGGDVINLVGSSTLTIDINDSSKLYEITIPTCSYRMGVPQMGFGAAVVGKCSLCIRLKFVSLFCAAIVTSSTHTSLA
jgi:hypothetical protein